MQPIPTGVKPYYNFSSFQVSSRSIGGGMSMVNTFMLNHIFTQTDFSLKYYNFSPSLTRVYNSAESTQTVSYNGNFGMFGKYWLCQYEHCLIEDENNNVTEISPTGARNLYNEVDENYLTPAGIDAELSKNNGEFDLETYDHITYHFKHYSGDTSGLYRLEYIEDQNGVRLRIIRGDSSVNFRIESIRGSTISDPTLASQLEDDSDLLFSFHYTKMTINLVTYHLVVSVSDHSGRQWLYRYNSSGELEKVTYPDGKNYNFEYDNDSLLTEVTDMRGIAWKYTYHSSAGDLATTHIDVNDNTQTTYYNWDLITQKTIIRDARSADNNDNTYEWEYTHGIVGYVMSYDDPLDNTTKMLWLECRLVKIEYPTSVENDYENYTWFEWSNGDLTEVRYYENGVQKDVGQKYIYDNEHNLIASLVLDGEGAYTGAKYSYDANHNLVQVISGIKFDQQGGVDIPSNEAYFFYDRNGLMTSSIDPNGNEYKMEYGKFGLLKKINPPLGAATYIEWDETCTHQAKIIHMGPTVDKAKGDLQGRIYEYKRNVYGQLLSTFAPMGVSSSQIYDAAGNVVSKIDPNGNVTNYSYYENNLVERIDFPDGGRRDFDYSNIGSRTSAKYYHDGSAKEYSYTYDNANRLTQVTNPLNDDINYTHNETGLVLSRSDNGGNAVTYTYDFMGRLIKKANPIIGSEISEIEYTYTGNNVTKITYRSGTVISPVNRDYNYTYLPNGKVSKIEYPQVSYDDDTYDFGVEYAYDKNLNEISKAQFQIINKGEIDEEIQKRWTYYTHDAVNRLTRMRNEYDTDKFIESILQYDSYGHIAAETKGGVTTFYETDDLGRVTCIWTSGDSQDNGLRFRYDKNGNRVETYEPGAGTTSFSYDSMNRVLTLTDQAGRLLKNEFYESGFLKKRIRPDSSYIRYEYDDLGRKEKVYELIRDYQNPLEPPTEAETLKVEYSWTGESPTTLQVKYKTLKDSPSTYYETIYNLDPLRRLWKTQYFDPDGSTIRTYEYIYDGVGNLKQIIKPDNITINYTYNLLNQVIKEEFGLNDYNEFQFDCRALTKHWRTISGSEDAYPCSITYDRLHRVVEESYHSNEKTEYKLDIKGRLTQIDDPEYGQSSNESRPTKIIYNESGQITRYERDRADNPIANQTKEDFEYHYDRANRLKSITFPSTKDFPNRTKIEYQYSDEHSLKAITVYNMDAPQPTEIYHLSYNFDSNGSICQKTLSTSSTANHPTSRISYEYDERGQLTRELIEKYDYANKVMTILADTRYEYDLAGNMTKKTTADGTVYTFDYSIGYQLTQITDGTNVWAFSYDANGNLTQRTIDTGSGPTVDFQATYNEHNKLKEYRFLSEGPYLKIEYDAMGRTWKRTDLTDTDSYFYHTGRQLMQELDDQFNVTTDYMSVANGSRRFMPGESAELKHRYFVRDHLGSVLMMSKDSANTEEYLYDAWGEHVDTDSYPDVPNNIRYAGARVECFVNQQHDFEAIYETGHRHYWASYGRFLQRDPLNYKNMPNPSFPISVNPYIYAHNNPVMKRDLSGLAPKGFYRGFFNALGMWFIGTVKPPVQSCYDCEKGYNTISDDNLDSKYFWNLKRHNRTGNGWVNLATWLADFGGWGDWLANLDFSAIQPDHFCVNNTYVDPDVGCSVLDMNFPQIAEDEDPEDCVGCNGNGDIGGPGSTSQAPFIYTTAGGGNTNLQNPDIDKDNNEGLNMTAEDELSLIFLKYNQHLSHWLDKQLPQQIQLFWGMTDYSPILNWGPARNFYGTIRGIIYGQWDTPVCHDIALDLKNELNKLDLKHWTVEDINLGIHRFVIVSPKGGSFVDRLKRGHHILDAWLYPRPINP